MALYFGKGRLNGGVLGKFHRAYEGGLVVEVLDPSPTRYERGQLLGAPLADWQEVNTGEEDDVRGVQRPGDLGADEGHGYRVQRAGDGRSRQRTHRE